jgi:uncharacterized repeat protein (TIGR03847 family)
MEIEAQRVRVEAVGQPGQRRFRMLVVVGGETYVAWMEKQQLQALGLALEQMLSQLPDTGPSLEGGSLPGEFDTETRRQFRVGRMELGYEERTDRVVIIAHDIGEDDDDGDEDDNDNDEPPALTCGLSRSRRARSALMPPRSSRPDAPAAPCAEHRWGRGRMRARNRTAISQGNWRGSKTATTKPGIDGVGWCCVHWRRSAFALVTGTPTTMSTDPRRVESLIFGLVLIELPIGSGVR